MVDYHVCYPNFFCHACGTHVLISTAASGRQDELAKVVDGIFDATFNKSFVEGDLPYVRWGRIDYMSVTALTTKWAIWQ